VNGVPITFAQRLLGHSTVEMTARVYTHLGEGQMRELSPRGKTYSLIWAGLALIAGALDAGWIAWHSDESGILLLPFALLLPAYGILLIVLFRQSRWKHAFAGRFRRPKRSTVEMTARVYAHLGDQRMREAIEYIAIASA
jgi:hypothetical protein